MKKIKINKYFKKSKKISLFLSLIYLTLYIPLMFTIYSISWYEFNYNLQTTYQSIGENEAINATNNLVNFFSYKENLNNLWNEKENMHMGEVRNIYLINSILAIISLFILISNYKFQKRKKIFKDTILKYSKKNIYIISSLILILPIFGFFWDSIFHLIMFNNNYWIINPLDISYYLFPLEFFRNSLIGIILISIIINLSIYFSLKNKLF